MSTYFEYISPYLLHTTIQYSEINSLWAYNIVYDHIENNNK